MQRQDFLHDSLARRTWDRCWHGEQRRSVNLKPLRFFDSECDRRARVLINIAAITTGGQLNIANAAACDPGCTYALWNGKAVEVAAPPMDCVAYGLIAGLNQITDDLLAIFMCPSDMNGVPCEYDEIGGCTKSDAARLVSTVQSKRHLSLPHPFLHGQTCPN